MVASANGAPLSYAAEQALLPTCLTTFPVYRRFRKEEVLECPAEGVDGLRSSEAMRNQSNRKSCS